MNDWSLHATVKLAGGALMPRLGLGVWQAPGPTAKQAVLAALEAGYRHVDSAAIYGNEAHVGEAVRESGVARDRVFVVTKLWTADHGYDSAMRAFDASLQRLGLDYVDQYLSHYPVEGKRVDAWKALLAIRESGRAKSVGVSNYLQRHLDDLLQATGKAPDVNQVEMHPFLYQKALIDFCTAKQIRIVAYSPLTHGQRLTDAKVGAVAKRHARTPAQVLIRWGLQHDFVVIPKSIRQERIVENGSVFDFELDVGDMRTLDGLNEDLRTCWDPNETP